MFTQPIRKTTVIQTDELSKALKKLEEFMNDGIKTLIDTKVTIDTTSENHYIVVVIYEEREYVPDYGHSEDSGLRDD